MGLNSRGAGGGGDIPSLDLQFATDKTLTARKGPTPVFTRASTATFVGSNGLIQSAAINAARFDHDPITLACKGLLIEESRTNLVFPSATLTTQTRTVTATAHTLSFYGTGTVVLSGVAIATVTGTGAYPTRTTLTFTPTAGSLVMTVTGSVTQAQLEAGAFPTSYIPTTTASVVRSADVCSISGSDFTSLYNATEGAVFADVITPDVNQAASIYYMNTTAGQNANTIFKLNSALNADGKRWTYFSTNSSGVPQAQITTPSDVAVLRSKVASAYKVNDFAFAHAGTIIGTDTSGTLPAPTQIGIGSRIGSSIILNGHISTLRYYRKRLSNSRLQSLTA